MQNINTYNTPAEPLLSIHHGNRSSCAVCSQHSRALQLGSIRLEVGISLPWGMLKRVPVGAKSPTRPPYPSFPAFYHQTRPDKKHKTKADNICSSLLSQAAVEDLQPPAALSLTPSDPISLALALAFERDYTHLTIVDAETRSLLGYIAIPQLQSLLDSGRVRSEDPISSAMLRFQRKGKKYSVITMDTPLEELEAFFEGAATGGQRQEFAVITDDNRRFVLGVATRGDLEEFAKRRPA